MQADPNADRTAGPSRRAAAVEYGFLALGWLVLVLGPHAVGGDGAVRFQALDNLFLRGRVPSTRYSLVGPLLSAPLWLAGRLGSGERFWCARYNLVVFTAGLWLLYRLLGDVARPEVRRRFLLLLVYASMFPHHQQDYYGEVFTAVLVGVGTLALAVRPGVAAWACVVLGVANTPASMVGLLLAGGYALLATRRWRWALLLPACAALVLLEALLRRGSVLATDYEGDHGFVTVLPYSGLPGFSYPLFFGVLGLLLSFGKGLLFFAPGTFLPLAPDAEPRLRFIHRLWLLFVAGLVLVYARWWAWYGGWSWGPRFLLFASLPASLALASSLGGAAGQSLGKNVATLLMLALSFWVGANGQLCGQASLGLCTENDYALEHLCWYVPEFSALWRPFVVLGPVPWEAVVVLLLWTACFLYLALPLARVCLRQGSEAARAWWRARPEGDRWRL